MDALIENHGYIPVVIAVVYFVCKIVDTFNLIYIRSELEKIKKKIEE